MAGAVMRAPLELPTPDFAEFEQILTGEQDPQRAHLVELSLDAEVLQVLAQTHLGEPWVPLTPESQELHLRQRLMLYRQLGYDYVPGHQWGDAWIGHPAAEQRVGEDTAELSRGERRWVEQRGGLITSWEDFERFPWDEIRPDYSPYEVLVPNLPEGMKIVVESCHFQEIFDALLGHEGTSYLLYDDPELVAQAFARWGQKVYDYYAPVIPMEEVGAIFHADDLGCKTATFFSPDVLRQHVFPWLKRYAALAHEHGKTFWYHCCGNVYGGGVIEDLIEDVHIDAFHAFQDVILSAVDFKARYGDRVAALGGVDMDKLARLDQPSLRAYVRSVLEQCMPGGMFALGSGDTVANHIPIQNYLIMREEALAWGRSS